MAEKSKKQYKEPVLFDVTAQAQRNLEVVGNCEGNGSVNFGVCLSSGYAAIISCEVNGALAVGDCVVFGTGN